MKRYEGGSLDKKIQDGPLDADKICRYAHALWTALRQLHECGLVVRDIKPPNILFDSFDQPVLADFGIAEVVSTATRHHTSIKGTFNYMAPETFLDAEAGGPGIGPPADVWAMACVVVEMHTRKVPWDGMNMQQIVRAVSVDYRAPAVPETARAHALLGRCFQRNPVDRPSAGDLADAFAPVISGAEDVVTAVCEENDRLKVACEELEAKLKACESALSRKENAFRINKNHMELEVFQLKLDMINIQKENTRLRTGVAGLYHSLHHEPTIEAERDRLDLTAFTEVSEDGQSPQDLIQF
jgi:serine/threonine protein kinase